MEFRKFLGIRRTPEELGKLKARLAELGIKRTRGPESGFAPDFPTPGPVSPKIENKVSDEEDTSVR